MEPEKTNVGKIHRDDWGETSKIILRDDSHGGYRVLDFDDGGSLIKS